MHLPSVMSVWEVQAALHCYLRQTQYLESTKHRALWWQVCEEYGPSLRQKRETFFVPSQIPNIKKRLKCHLCSTRCCWTNIFSAITFMKSVEEMPLRPHGAFYWRLHHHCHSLVISIDCQQHLLLTTTKVCVNELWRKALGRICSVFSTLGIKRHIQGTESNDSKEYNTFPTVVQKSVTQHCHLVVTDLFYTGLSKKISLIYS